MARFTNDTKIVNSIISDRDRQSLQGDLRKISAWSDRWEMPFNDNKSHILHVGTRSQKYEFKMSGVKLENVQCVKYLGVTIASNLTFSVRCKEAACKASKMLGFKNINFSFNNKRYNSTYSMCMSLARPHFEYAVQSLVASPSKVHIKIRSCLE